MEDIIKESKDIHPVSIGIKYTVHVTTYLWVKWNNGRLDQQLQANKTSLLFSRYSKTHGKTDNPVLKDTIVLFLTVLACDGREATGHNHQTEHTTTTRLLSVISFPACTLPLRGQAVPVCVPAGTGNSHHGRFSSECFLSRGADAFFPHPPPYSPEETNSQTRMRCKKVFQIGNQACWWKYISSCVDNSCPPLCETQLEYSLLVLMLGRHKKLWFFLVFVA